LLLLIITKTGVGLSRIISAPYDAIVQIVEGSARLTIGGKDVMAKTGNLVVMPANIPHAVYADERFKMLLTMIRDKKED